MSSAAEQVTFLLGCIKHTNNGKIDFDAHAAELSLTKGAAYKRYTRLKARAQESDLSTGSAPCTPSAGGDDNDASGAPLTPTCTKAKRARAAGTKTSASKPATKRQRVQVATGQEEDTKDSKLPADMADMADMADQDRRLQEQTLADAGAFRLVAEIDRGGCKTVAQVEEEEAVEDKTI